MRLATVYCIFLLLISGCAKSKDGKDGGSGAAGNNGAPGSNGQDATPITAVKFCIGATTVYPTSFPEYGFCINGKIYATYWDGTNAWTAEVVPGYYSSTSTSAPCSFSVTANCVIGN